MDLKSKLDQMVSRTFVYDGNFFKLLRYRFDQGTSEIILTSPAGEVKIPFTDADKILSQFSPLTPAEQVSSTPAIVSAMDNTTITSLRDTLLDNIARVKGNPAYVKQANAVNQSVGAIIDLAKAEIDYIKLSKKLSND